MTLEEAKALIDRAWNSPPSAIDWNDVEEASMVIAAETGEVYIPGRPPAPSSRGTADGYDLAVRGDGEPCDACGEESCTSGDCAAYLSSEDPLVVELDDVDEAEARFVSDLERGVILSPGWSQRARSQL